MGMGNASACTGDAWSILNNIGGLSQVSNTSIAFSQYAVPSFKPFNRMAATLAVPVKVGVAGIGFFRFGDELYSEQIITAGYSNKFGLASLGIKVNYIQYHAEGFGTSGNVTVSFGGIAEITPRFFVGACIENLNQPKLSSQSDQRVQTDFTVATGFKLSEKTYAIVELEKNIQDKSIIKAGLEYELHNKITARTGFNMNPQSAFAGVGFKLSKFKIDYAFQLQEYLGSAHQATVTTTPFKKK